MWKYIGDEVLFYQKIQRRDDLAKALPAAYDALAATTSVLHQNFPETKDILSVKGTVWVACAQAIRSGSKESVLSAASDHHPNIVLPTGRTPSESIPDFLGPDIDAGFRISRFALRRRLVVSAALAWLLYRSRETIHQAKNSLRIVDLQSLKGVWGGRHYPIVWFEPSWANISKSFLYDEHLSSELVLGMKRGSIYPAHIDLIEKIYEDLGKVDEVQRLDQAVREIGEAPSDPTPEIEISAEKFSEVHCVAVCFTADGRVLTAKRPSTKRRFPDHFEFGCGQLRLGETFGQCLRRAYRDDFGIELKVLDDPIPISTFIIHDADESRKIPGITFIAEVIDPSMVEAKFSREKHSKIRWVDPARFAARGAKYVPDFKETLLRASAARKAVLQEASESSAISGAGQSERNRC